MKDIDVVIRMTLTCRGDTPEDIIDWMAMNLAEHANKGFGSCMVSPLVDRVELEWKTVDYETYKKQQRRATGVKTVPFKLYKTEKPPAEVG